MPQQVCSSELFLVTGSVMQMRQRRQGMTVKLRSGTAHSALLHIDLYMLGSS